MASETPTPESASSYAEKIVEAAYEISKVKLDFTPSSLQRVDDIIEGFRNEGLEFNTISGTLFCFGCYVGEVFVRNACGVWRKASEFPKFPTNAPVVVELENGKVVNPIDKVVKRLENGEIDSIVYFYNVFTQDNST